VTDVAEIHAPEQGEHPRPIRKKDEIKDTVPIALRHLAQPLGMAQVRRTAHWLRLVPHLRLHRVGSNSVTAVQEHGLQSDEIHEMAQGAGLVYRARTGHAIEP
jgi:hypothetical protein